MKIGRASAFAAGLVLPACSVLTSLDGYSDGAPLPDASDDGSTVTDAPPDRNEAAATSSYRDLILAEKPVAYFRMGETAGSATLRDEVTSQSSPIAGTVERGVVGSIAGDSDTAMTFEGHGSIRVAGSDASFSGVVPYSIECWIRPSEVDENYRRIVSNEIAGTDPRQGWLLWIVDRTSGGVGFERYVDGKGEGVISRSIPPPDRWTHVVGTYDGSALSLYIDGVLIDTAISPRPLEGQANLTLGKGIADGIIGGLDEVAIYDRALTTERIALHHARGSTAP
jgi:hypothetical protein